VDTSRIEQLPPLHVTLGWYLYFCMRDDSITSVAVDLTFGTDPADSQLSWLTIIRIDLLTPDAGLAVGTEAVVLDELQERLEEVANSLGNGILDRVLRRAPPRFRYVGRETGGGSRQLYFYGTAAMPEIVYERVFADARFDPYNVASAEREESEHITYRNDLHPGAALNALVLGDAQIEMRREQGDRLDVKREVEHALWFRSALDRQAFLEFLHKEDPAGLFKINDSSGSGSTGERFGVTITTLQSVDRIWSDIFTIGLSNHAARFGGTYDGWSALVIPDDTNARTAPPG